MKLPVLTLLAALSLSGAAFAQATSPAAPSNTNNAAPRANTGSPGSGTPTNSSNPAVNTTGNAPTANTLTGRADIVPLSRLEKGANSFTQGQAQSRLEGAGFTQVTDLKKDDQGIWRGKAMRDGKTVTVGFDYKGVIGAE